MTIQIPNVGTGVPADQTGDSPWLAMKKVAYNFSDPTNAASRLVGTAAGNVMEVGAFGLGAGTIHRLADIAAANVSNGFFDMNFIEGFDQIYASGIRILGNNKDWRHDILIPAVEGAPPYIRTKINDREATQFHAFCVIGRNVTKDSNGFLKGASPVIDLYNDKIGLNHDAEQQGGIMFEKLGVGDYLIKGSLGFAQEGWYIETPKDANGNVLVAVVYEQLSNNDLSIKTYAKRFDDETGDIVANLLKPRDIPTGRFISLRLHELPKEPPVMPTATQTEV